MKLCELGEFELIKRIKARVGHGSGILRGIGDDAAQLEIEPGFQLLTSTDLLIEKSHFDFAWTLPEDLGYKAVAVNLSDIAAMGGTPRYLYLGLACPGSAEVERIEAFMDGALELAENHGVILVGGDTCSSPGPWVISVTVEGVVPAGRAIGRDGAQPGDVILVSGTLGDSALGLSLLRQGGVVEEALAMRHHRPQARVELGQALAETGCVTAMIDVSDGTVSDLGHILQASGAAGILDVPKLPLSDAFATALRNRPDLVELALAGGEDYELLFTTAEEDLAVILAVGKQLGIPLTPIGKIRSGEPVLYLRDASGHEKSCLAHGFDHFSPTSGSGAS
ncbi:MAG: thiamine-phosphate kinase [Desulfuromonadales bacterium]|nr:thiamine-phosphate kinase [Desulfuromonadales bacterium]